MSDAAGRLRGAHKKKLRNVRAALQWKTGHVEKN